MPINLRQSERTADRLEDLASALAAGLSPRTILEGPAFAGARGPIAVDHGMVEAFRRRGLHLRDIDWAILEAAERAGDLVAGLRERADAARLEVHLLRMALARAAYPALVLVVASVTIAWVHGLGFTTRGPLALLIVAVAVFAAGAAFGYLRRRARSDPRWDGRGIPGLPRILRDIGELPYLIALRGLYAAGVRIAEAHEGALATISIASVRGRLQQATDRVRSGAGYSATLTELAALDRETLDLLTTGDAVGDLEGSLQRAAARKRERLTRSAHRIIRVVGTALYFAAVFVVAIVVLDFYGALLRGAAR